MTVFLAVDRRGQPKFPAGWTRTAYSLTWGRGFRDDVYSRDFPAGRITIPGNTTEHTRGSFGMPHAAFVESHNETPIGIRALGDATATFPKAPRPAVDKESSPVIFTLQVDRQGNGEWVEFADVKVASNGYVAYALPADLDAVWLRLIPSRDCVATAFLHQTTGRFSDGELPENNSLFAGLANVDDKQASAGLVYAAKRNRNLTVITAEDRCYEFTKSRFEFKADTTNEKLKKLLAVEPEFTVDDASVIIESRGKRYRLPKGIETYGKPFASGWPRASREVESERHLANIHGTFYEVPLITNGAPPAWNLMRPISSHSKQITDFCSWNGLLVLSGVRHDAPDDDHVFQDSKLGVGLWLGAIDDLWKLGKPVGHGGPWKDTRVGAGDTSDQFLMTGYDRKTLTLMSSAAAIVSVEVDITGEDLWVPFRSFNVDSNAGVTYEFPKEFSARWIRFRCSAEAIVTAQLKYE